MQLNDILSISQIDYEKFSLNKNGTKASKPKNWYLAGRIILWFLSCGRFQVNPNLNEGSRKVIDATKEHLKFLKGEINIVQACDDFTASLQKMRIMQKVGYADKGIREETKQVLKKIKEIKNQALQPKKDPAVEGLFKKFDELKNQPLQPNAPALDDLLKKIDQLKAQSVESRHEIDSLKAQVVYIANSNNRNQFIQDIMAGTIPNREAFLRQVVIYYPEVEMYKGVKEGTPEFRSAAAERQRTEMSMLFIYWLFKHDIHAATEQDDLAYQEFIHGQDPDGLNPHKVLSWESFKELSSDFQEQFDTEEKLDFFLVTMALHDLGKVDYIQRLAHGDAVEVELHDEILLHIFKNRPEILSSFVRLTPEYQKLLIAAWEMDFLDPQFMQGEMKPKGLIKVLKQMNEDPAVVEHFLIHDLCDLAGAAGCGKDKQGKLNGCITLTQDTYDSWKKTYDVINDIDDEKEAYVTYLDFRADLLKRPNDKNKQIDPKDLLNFDVNNSADDYAFIRLCCMARLFYHEDAKKLKDAFENLKKNHLEVYNNLVAELNKSGIDSNAIMVYYSPALMSNIGLYPFAGSTPEQRYEEGLKLLNEVFVKTRNYLNDQKIVDPGVFTVNATEIAAKFAKPAPNTPVLKIEDVRQSINSIKFNAKNKHAEIMLIPLTEDEEYILKGLNISKKAVHEEQKREELKEKMQLTKDEDYLLRNLNMPLENLQQQK